MTMKNIKNKFWIILCGLLFISACTLTAQQIKRSDMIFITPVVSDELEMPGGVRSVLENKVRQMLTANGFSSYTERFVLVPNITVLSKNVTATAPPMFALDLDISFHILDVVEGTIINEISYPVKGVDRQEHKAFIQAINKINPRSAEVSVFVNGSKKRIIEYYNARLSILVKQAESMAAQGKYEAAISRLTFIPEVVDNYDVVADAISSIYRQYLNREADSLINKARSHIAVRQYSDAMEALAQVDPVSDRYETATALVKKVKDSIDASARASIARQEKRYEDKKEAFYRVHDDKVALTKLQIEAARDVGIAQAENQKPSVIQIVNNWFKSKFR
jgi:hypothetical protein